jgi:hypothetical protein
VIVIIKYNNQNIILDSSISEVILSLRSESSTCHDIRSRDEDTHGMAGPQFKVAQRAIDGAMLGVSLRDRIRNQVIRQRTLKSW